MKEKRKETAPGMILGLVLGLIFMMALAGPALAQGPVLRTSPAQDCAVVTSMPGFPKFKTSSLVEKEIFIEGEGVVIRQSQVKNGKIYIPPGGLYYTVRTHWFQGELRWPLANYPMLLLGKTYYLADAGHNYGVKRDFVVKKGEAVPFGEGGNALELSSVENSWGDESPNHPAVFRVLKPSGNYYGNQWGTSTGGRYARSVEDALKGKPAKAPMVYQLSPLATVGTAYLLAEEVTLKQAKISQWGFSEVMTVDLAEKAMTATAGVGGTMDLGKYQAKVLDIDAAAKTAKVAIQEGNRIVAEKKLGPLTEEVLYLLPSYDGDLQTLLLKHDNVEVGLAAYNQPFGESGKVKLVGYTGTFQTKVGGAWKEDPRFVIYHDT